MVRAYKEYTFIAHVKIIKKLPLDKQDSSLVNSSRDLNHYSKVSVEVIELYKGTSEITILEWGVSTSCDMGLRENDEWLLFGNYINKEFVSVSSCNTWFLLKNSSGERQWLYDHGLVAAKQLRKLAGMPEKISPDGRITTYYRNGEIMATEEYKNGTLQGNRKIYFSNGLLMEEGEYSEGVLQGKQTHYAKHGQLLKEFVYEKGEIVRSIYWFDTSWEARRMASFFSEDFRKTENVFPARIQKESEGWFDLATKSRHSFVYYRSGQIEKEHIAFREEAFKISCEYFESGNLKFELHYFKEGDISEEKNWDDSGRLLSDKKWSKGKFLGDAMKK